MVTNQYLMVNHLISHGRPETNALPWLMMLVTNRQHSLDQQTTNHIANNAVYSTGCSCLTVLNDGYNHNGWKWFIVNHGD